VQERIIICGLGKYAKLRSFVNLPCFTTTKREYLNVKKIVFRNWHLQIFYRVIQAIVGHFFTMLHISLATPNSDIIKA